MNKKGPIIFIEDDVDDQELLGSAFKELGYKNELIYFKDGETALDYLIKTKVKPFIIFSDINMPKLNGLALRDILHTNEDLRLKSIPYLFFTTAAEQPAVVDAYSKSVQGFFIKPHSFTELKRVLKNIVEYWIDCVAPDYVK